MERKSQRRAIAVPTNPLVCGRIEQNRCPTHLCGLETRDSGEYHFVKGQPRRRKKQVWIRGLNKDYNHDLKGLFKAAAMRASVLPGPFQDFYQRSLAKGIKPTMVRLTLARKIAAITLTLWKKGENFDAEKLKSQAA